MTHDYIKSVVNGDPFNGNVIQLDSSVSGPDDGGDCVNEDRLKQSLRSGVSVRLKS